MKQLLDGKKSYLAGGGMIVYAVLGFALGYQSADEAFKLASMGAGVMGLRAAIANK